MPDEWSAKIVGQMHVKRLTGRELADLTGYTEQYISMVLNGHKDAERAKENIEKAVNEYELLRPEEKKGV